MNKQDDRNCICRKNVIHFQKQSVPTAANLSLGFLSVRFLKLVGSWSAEAVWRFHRSCSCQDVCGIYYACAVLGSNLAQQNTSWETPIVITE